MTSFPLISAPGLRQRASIRQMVELGRQIRDELLWLYPTPLPDAFYIFQQLASGREWKMSGSAAGVSRAVEWVNNAQTATYDGLVDYGFEQFLRRRSADYNCIGRTMYTWDKGKPLRYLDPADMDYDLQKREWRSRYTGETFPVERMVVNHPIPIGIDGFFSAPLWPLIPTAALAWLIREHDRAAVDGRKIRDITIVLGEALATQIEDAMNQSLQLWSGGDPSQIGVPVIYAENVESGVKASDLVTRMGLANIPENFNREGFQFQYVNGIGASLGLALRHFWNSEKATNRALEDVQEARQQQKGPASFVRSEQRLHNQSGELRQFGPSVRFGFIEEVDIANREVSAKVLLAYAQSLQIFTQALGASIKPESLIAWLQNDGILPPDLDIIANSTQENPETMPTPTNGNALALSDSPQKSAHSLEKGEISMDQYGRIIERRSFVIPVEKFFGYAEEAPSPLPSFEGALVAARQAQAERFFALADAGGSWGDHDEVKALLEVKERLTDGHYRQIKALLEAHDNQDVSVSEATEAMLEETLEMS